MIWFSYHFILYYWTPFLSPLHCLQFWIWSGTIDDIGPFLFSIHIYFLCVHFRFLALNTFYILYVSNSEHCFDLRIVIPTASEANNCVCDKHPSPIMDIQNMPASKRCETHSLDYSYDSPQMQWFSNCVSKSPLKYLTDSHQAWMIEHGLPPLHP